MYGRFSLRYKNLDVGFIGLKYGKSSQLTVLAFDSYRRGKKDRIYKVHCSECAKDTELFGDGTFLTSRAVILRGIEPCGCSRAPRYTEDQYKVLVSRKSKELSYEFLGWAKDYDGVFSRLDMSCKLCGNSWQTGTVERLLMGVGCPRCSAIATGIRYTKSDKVMVDSFLDTGKFVEGTKFSRSLKVSADGSKDHWDVYCPVCSNDKFVVAGLCTGKFSAVSYSLQKGAHPCRCGGTYRWTAEQKEFQINERITDDKLPYTFVGWVDEYRGYDSRFTMNCSVHGNWTARLDAFLYPANRSGCPTCAKSGYSTHKQGWLYILQIEGVKGDFTGYGISNTPDRRIRDHTKNLMDYGFKIAGKEVFPCGGQQAWDIEKLLKQTFPCHSQEMMGFKREATHAHLYQNVVDFVQDQIHNTA